MCSTQRQSDLEGLRTEKKEDESGCEREWDCASVSVSVLYTAVEFNDIFAERWMNLYIHSGSINRIFVARSIKIYHRKLRFTLYARVKFAHGFVLFSTLAHTFGRFSPFDEHINREVYTHKNLSLFFFFDFLLFVFVLSIFFRSPLRRRRCVPSFYVAVDEHDDALFRRAAAHLLCHHCLAMVLICFMYNT